jgi:hypothetical protein
MERFINMALIKEPMNWGIVFLIASVWLILFHVVMQGFAAMSAGPGVPAPSGQGQARGPDVIMPASLLIPSGTSGVWTDGVEANYTEDGWTH